MLIAMWIIFTPILLWLFISPIIFVYWLFDRDCFRKYQAIHKHKVIVIGIGALLATGIFLVIGMEHCLIFIPASWGNLDEGGEWISTRYAFAVSTPFPVLLVLCEFLSRHFKLLDERIGLKASVQFNAHKERYATADAELLSSAIADCNNKLTDYYRIQRTDYLTEDEDVDYHACSLLLEHLQRRSPVLK